VFDEVMAKWDSMGGKLSVALLQRYEASEQVREMCEKIRTANMDSHLLFSQVGERLGLIPEATVAAAFANIWAQGYPEVINNILQPFVSLLPKEKEPPVSG